MKITRRRVSAHGIRFSVKVDGKEVAHAYLYLLFNDLHSQPFGFMEDVMVQEIYRGGGVGAALVGEIVDYARRKCCYKLVATSRNARTKVHALYERLGFANYGLEFRIDFP